MQLESHTAGLIFGSDGDITLLFCFGSLQIMEKLVDIVTYVHQAILEAFGNSGKSKILGGHYEFL